MLDPGALPAGATQRVWAMRKVSIDPDFAAEKDNPPLEFSGLEIESCRTVRGIRITDVKSMTRLFSNFACRHQLCDRSGITDHKVSYLRRGSYRGSGLSNRSGAGGFVKCGSVVVATLATVLLASGGASAKDHKVS